jgi:cell division protein FtsN
MSDFHDRYKTEQERIEPAYERPSRGGWAVLAFAAVVIAVAGMLYLTAGPQTDGNVPVASNRSVTPEDAAPVSPETTGSVDRDRTMPATPAE